MTHARFSLIFSAFRRSWHSIRKKASSSTTYTLHYRQGLGIPPFKIMSGMFQGKNELHNLAQAFSLINALRSRYS